MRALLPCVILAAAALTLGLSPRAASAGPPEEPPWLTPLGFLEGLPGPPSLAATPFATGAPFVDGISDQSLPSWDGSFATSPFAGLFRDAWVAAGGPDLSAPEGGLDSRGGADPRANAGVGNPDAHISFARYVVQWNVLSGAYPDYLAQLQAWFRDVLDLGLTPDLSLTSYDGVLPRSSAQYSAALRALLVRFPATAYVEAWDEPNRAPALAPATAARYTLAAASLCHAGGCTVIAGNLLDTPNIVAYERAYERALAPATEWSPLPDWGIHPYLAIKTRDATPVLAFKAALPHEGAGERVWFTEVGAYRCEGGATPLLLGEAAQARAAAWLVNRLMPLVQPVHVFYYELLYRDNRPPPCDRSDSDTALYAPAGTVAGAGGPTGVDIPRAAASYIYDDDRGALPTGLSE